MTWRQCVGKGKEFGKAKAVVLRHSDQLCYNSDTDEVWSKEIESDNEEDISASSYSEDIQKTVQLETAPTLDEVIRTSDGNPNSGPIVGLKWLNSQVNAHAGVLGVVKNHQKQYAFLNVGEPFCAVITGVQGAGKSHSFNVILENCLVRFPRPAYCPLIRLPCKKLCGLVCHYDRCQWNCPESCGLSKMIDETKAANVIILVSPDFYQQRRKFYGDNFDVRPLLFKWSKLDAAQLRTLMRLNDDDQQLYVATMLDKLRSFQRENRKPAFPDFITSIETDMSSKGQIGPLRQRLRLLEALVFESERNKEFCEQLNEDDLSIELDDIVTEGTLVVADLTDPMLASDEANGIFTVLLDNFRQLHRGFGKIVAFDEAHRYLSRSSTGLSSSILDTVRLMRHEGIRILLSTQSPEALPTELLELVSLAIIHRFQSPSWFNYLSSKLPLTIARNNQEMTFQQAMNLAPGHALVFTASNALDMTDQSATIFELAIRNRLTQDFGASRRHG
eukprot:CAMPEP_0197308388 /NCGR_PEP_ID=MMETSP0891-20130614/6745_1 /TAXON_ID=44058 ORGANISM="Aureoumbra lagunensis, Strain CCMP1510" /NCGR_SAMPLE_ID=MMETSP0891 /ASSEMBLY_ACC=CAM_ASM_000534 /LENGTH=502 /DNA_ID=CAMNT_0042792739 /DNA_START=246 /DNA_END=1754 /DNA_ORIENTATION=-